MVIMHAPGNAAERTMVAFDGMRVRLGLLPRLPALLAPVRSLLEPPEAR